MDAIFQICGHKNSMQDIEKWIGLLQKCKKAKNFERARYIWALICKRKLDSHPILANHLIPMLVECQNMHDAKVAFDSLPAHQLNHHAWNSLILGYVHSRQSQYACHLFYRMQKSNDCIQPDKMTYLAMLNATTQLQDSVLGQKLHNQILQRGLEREILFGSAHICNTLICMYGKCGLLEDALHVFTSLPLRNVIAWANLITAFSEHGLSHEAWQCVQQMQMGGISPDSVTFVCCLKAHKGVIYDLGAGQMIHTETVKRGMERELYVGSVLVDMYSGYGSMLEARHVLDVLVVRNAVSWNTLILGYTEHCQCKEALTCFRQMQSEGKPPDCITFVATLKACYIVQSLETGQEIHAEATKRGLDHNLYLGSLLVDVYGQCHSFGDAIQVFHALPIQDVVSWNAVIGVYILCGLEQEAGHCFEQLLVEGISPNPVTFVSCLKACVKTRDLQTGEKLHSEAAKRGWEGKLHVGSMLVDMYSECGLLSEVHSVFDKLMARDKVSWGALTAGYAVHGLSKDVGSYFGKMLVDGVPPDHITFACLLKGCGELEDLEQGRELHSEVVKRGLDNNISVGIVLVDMHCKFGLLSEAHHVFHRLPVSDTGSWAALIEGYVEQGLDVEVSKFLQEMELECSFMEPYMFVCFLKAFGNIGAVKRGQVLHMELIKRGLEEEPYVGCTLIDMYGNCRFLEEACQVFEQLSTPSVESWSALIKAYGKNYEGDLAVNCFQKMQNEGVKPCAVTFICLLAACSYTGLIIKGLECFKLMREEYKIRPTLEHLGCMVNLLARSGHTREAERFAVAIHNASNMMLYNIIGACTIYGNVELGEVCFQQLVKRKLENIAACLLLADVYVNAGWLKEANRLEKVRQRLGVNKLPGTACIEVNGILCEFFVCVVNQDEESIQSVILQMRNAGYVPNLDLISS